jgi:predicted metal-dependent phosphoesterase TrpH
MTTADLHVHTIYSHDSVITPQALLKRAQKLGLDIVCITDHSIFDDNIELETLKTISKKPLIIRGVELATDNGEILIFGLKNDFWKKLMRGMEVLPPISKVIEAVNEFNGVAIWAHPFRNYNVIHYNTEYSTFKGINILEALNGRNDNRENSEAINYAKKHNYKIAGGSDAHKASDIGKCLTLFKDTIKTEEEFIAALKRSNYMPITLEDFLGKDLEQIIKNAAL